jgi:hypothetical protein
VYFHPFWYIVSKNLATLIGRLQRSMKIDFYRANKISKQKNWKFFWEPPWKKTNEQQQQTFCQKETKKIAANFSRI